VFKLSLVKDRNINENSVKTIVLLYFLKEKSITIKMEFIINV
jgi:hypothetical protein